MKKHILKPFATLLAILFSVVFPLSAFADTHQVSVALAPYSIEIKNDSMLDNATKLSETETRENGRVTTTTKYLMPDGSILEDIFERGEFFARGNTGSDTATRTRVNGVLSLSLTASFHWYFENG